MQRHVDRREHSLARREDYTTTFGPAVDPTHPVWSTTGTEGRNL